MKNKLLLSGLGLAYLLNISPVVSQTIGPNGPANPPVKVRIPKDVPEQTRHTIDSLVKLVEQKYRALEAPIQYNLDMLTARRKFSLDSLEAEKRRALAGLPDSARQQRELLNEEFKIKRDNINLQSETQIRSLRDQLTALNNQKQTEINAIIMQYIPGITFDTLRPKPVKDHPLKDSLDLKGRNSKVTPNPSNGEGQIIVDKYKNGETLTLNILDSNGSIVKTTSQQSGTFSFSGLKQGFYYYIITEPNGKKTSEGRILVQ